MQYKRELKQFLQQTVWANIDVFECNQAAEALAKRGVNIDRLYMGISPGGVGQSLYSLHLAAKYGGIHGYFDANVWYHDDELRKQVESFVDKLIHTAQDREFVVMYLSW